MTSDQSRSFEDSLETFARFDILQQKLSLASIEPKRGVLEAAEAGTATEHLACGRCNWLSLSETPVGASPDTACTIEQHTAIGNWAVASTITVQLQTTDALHAQGYLI